jgi:metal-responsive CopG/Arc/MetJ family transcriptional regulator
METKLINFTIPQKLLINVDKLARKKRASRSELLRQAVRDFLEKEQTRTQAFNLIMAAGARNNLSLEKAAKLAGEAKIWARKQ